MEPLLVEHALPDTARLGVKLVIAGAFGVGKTTMVRSVSEIRPLVTEETMTQASVGVDSTTGVETKSTTTVAMDFGRITVDDEMILYLFGTPGQERFWFLWNGLFEGALGAVVLVDTRRLEDSFGILEKLEASRTPFIVAINTFPDSIDYSHEEVRQALDLPPGVPIVGCDARRRDSSRDALLTLLHYLQNLADASEVS
nr:ATP/GTP-binding protein [Streptomyces sp. YIM 98790]